MTKKVRATFWFWKDIPDPKPEYWIGDEYFELQTRIAKVCHELGWELEWRETSCPEVDTD